MSDVAAAIHAFRSWFNQPPWMVNPDCYHLTPVTTARGVVLRMEIDHQSHGRDITGAVPAEFQGFPIEVVPLGSVGGVLGGQTIG